MTTLTPAESDTVWAAIDDQRARTADLLEQLSPQQWEHPSLCQGWTVRHVAAHLTMQQQRIRDAVAFVARHVHDPMGPSSGTPPRRPPCEM